MGRLSVIGILFDTENYDEVSDETVAAIDKFFDSMDMRQVDKTTSNNKNAYFTPQSEVALGELMAVVDLGNRWVYSGSLTTPPCLENLYWNVVKTVYPIKKHHFAYYKNMRDTLSVAFKSNPQGWENFVNTKGNNRFARDADTGHNVQLLTPKPPAEAAVTDEDVDSAESTSLAMIILFCISMFLVVGLTVYVCILHDNLKKGSSGEGRIGDDKADVAPVPMESVDAPVKGEDA